MTDEYWAAKAAYDEALARLIEAKRALARKPNGTEVRRARQAETREALWQEYVGGRRDYTEMGRPYRMRGKSVYNMISRMRRERAFGPITAKEHAWNEYLASIVPISP